MMSESKKGKNLSWLTTEEGIDLIDPAADAGKPAGLKRSRDAMAGDVAGKLLAFSKQTRSSFLLEFPATILPVKCGGLKPHYSIPPSVILLFLAFWIIVCDSVLRFGSGEKVKYFPIFTLLGTIAMLANSGSMVSTATPTHDDELTPETLADETRISLTIKKLKELFRFIGHEEHIGRGALEFMIFRNALSQKIESVLVVKDTLPSSTDLLKKYESPIWQLYCELCRALLQNGAEGEDEVWGALTDEVSWYFAKVARTADGTVTLYLSNCLIIQKSREGGFMDCTHDTKECLEFLFTVVQGTSDPTDAYSDLERMARTIDRIKLLTDQAVEHTAHSFRMNCTELQAKKFAEEVSRNKAQLKSAYGAVIAYKREFGDAATAEDCAIANPTLDAELIKELFSM